MSVVVQDCNPSTEALASKKKKKIKGERPCMKLGVFARRDVGYFYVIRKYDR